MMGGGARPNEYAEKEKEKMLSVSSEERHFWSLVVSLMNNTSHHTKDTPVIAQKIYEKTSSCTSYPLSLS